MCFSDAATTLCYLFAFQPKWTHSWSKSSTHWSCCTVWWLVNLVPSSVGITVEKAGITAYQLITSTWWPFWCKNHSLYVDNSYTTTCLYDAGIAVCMLSTVSQWPAKCSSYSVCFEHVYVMTTLSDPNRLTALNRPSSSLDLLTC